MLAGAPRRGHDPRVLLAGVDLPATLLDTPGARVPLARYAALYDHVVRALEDEGFGLFERPLRPGVLEGYQAELARRLRVPALAT